MASLVTYPDVDITCISVGFDLRAHTEMRVSLPKQDTLTVCYESRNNGPRTVVGDRTKVVATLRRAGYKISNG